MTPNIYQLLDDLSIPFERIQHPPVFTAQQARQLIPPQAAIAAKNLFLRDKKGKNHVLLSLADHKTARFADIETQTGLKSLSLASTQRLNKYLGITPGAVSLLALINDPHGDVRVVIDSILWESKRIQLHPLINTETLIMDVVDLERFVKATNHAIEFVDVI